MGYAIATFLAGCIIGFLIAANAASDVDAKRAGSGLFYTNGHVYRLVEVSQ